MSKQMMTEQKFKNIVSSYGGEQDRWPEADRKEILSFISHNPSAQAVIDQAKLLDGLLSQLPEPKAADDAFLERLSVMPPPQKQNKRWGMGDIFKGLPSFNPYGFMPRAVGLASVCAVGIGLGLSDIARYENTATSVDATSLIFATSSVANDMEEID